MSREKILVPIGPDHHDFNALYHALALAERIQAKIYVLYLSGVPGGRQSGVWVEKHLKELVARACQEGLPIACHMAGGSMAREALRLVVEHQIDIVIFESDGRNGLVSRTVEKIISTIPIQAVQVNGKSTPTYKRRKDGLKCRSS